MRDAWAGKPDAIARVQAPERVAALEARISAAARQSEPLRARNAARVAAGARLRSAIGAILAAHPAPAPMSSKHVLRALARSPDWREHLPSLRTVQWHMAAVRAPR